MNLQDIKNKMLNDSSQHDEIQRLNLIINDIKSSIFTAIGQQLVEIKEEIHSLSERVKKLEKREK